ncbi:carboxypeptidase-like regulatory domain-containing protein [Thermodesulfobacteriota bacterium]
MNRMKHIFYLLVCAILISGCTISHTFGPYEGKVVDSETGAPIEGAVVLLRFYTVGIGPEYKIVDIIETLTNKNGEFEIKYKVTKFRFLHNWQKYPLVNIFSPGYGAYPEHQNVEPKSTPFGTLPNNEFVTVKLPRLHTLEERKKNLRNISYPMSRIPFEKQHNFIKLINTEELSLGLEPTTIIKKGAQ